MKSIKKILKQNWRFMYDRGMTYQKVRLFNTAYTAELAELFDVRLTKWLCGFNDGLGSEYYITEEYDALIDAMKSKVAGNNVKFLKKLQKLITLPYFEFDKHISRMQLAYSGTSNARLYKFFSNYVREERKICLPNWLLFEPFELAMVNALGWLLSRHFSTQQAAYFLEELSQPTKPISLEQYKIDVAKTVIKGTADVLVKKLHSHYIHTTLFDVHQSPKELDITKREVEAMTKKQAVRYLDDIKQKYLAQLRTNSQIQKQLLKFKDFTYLVPLYTTYVNFKEWKNFYRQKSSYKLAFLLKEIGRRFNYSLSETAFCTDEEIKNLLLKRRHPDTTDLSRRQSFSLFYFHKRLEVITDRNMVSQFQTKLKHKTQETTLQGTAVYPGRAKGRAVIVQSVTDVQKVKKGDVLIASTTRGEYLEGMQKAAAYITNEGGLLSHAAILARELKKPCVIGTKIATKIFKDGDMVEVDANKGIVKKL